MSPQRSRPRRRVARQAKKVRRVARQAKKVRRVARQAKNSGRARRLKAVRAGRRAETLCAWVLRFKGYRVLARDLRTPVGEIDIVARRRQVLAVVEVKTRATLDVAAEALGAEQRRRIERAAGYMLATLPNVRDADIRFDVMLVAPWRLPVHIMDAWGH